MLVAGPLANLLRQNHRIYDSACDEAAQIFIANANYLGVLDADKHLRVNGTAPTASTAPPAVMDTAPEAEQVEPSTPVIIMPSQQSGGHNNERFGNRHQSSDAQVYEEEPRTLHLPSKRKALLYLPVGELAEKDWQAILTQIGVWKEL